VLLSNTSLTRPTPPSRTLPSLPCLTSRERSATRPTHAKPTPLTLSSSPRPLLSSAKLITSPTHSSTPHRLPFSLAKLRPCPCFPLKRPLFVQNSARLLSTVPTLTLTCVTLFPLPRFYDDLNLRHVVSPAALPQ
jgi:hypothetical protein